MGLPRLVTAVLAAGLVTAGAALGARGAPVQAHLDHAGSGLARQGVAPVRASRPEGLPGLDVSSWQGNVDWTAVWAGGGRFAYVKATESTTYVNPYFTQQYMGAYQVGLVRGAYHFALPDRSSGATQADFFAAHGGAWSADSQTLPGALDIEYNPYGPTCYGLSQSAMAALGLELRGRVPGADRPLARDLHDHELVAAVHRQLCGARCHEPALDRLLVPDGRAAARRLEHVHVLAVVEPAGRLPR